MTRRIAVSRSRVKQHPGPVVILRTAVQHNSEIEVNMFAAALLMPEEFLRKDLLRMDLDELMLIKPFRFSPCDIR